MVADTGIGIAPADIDKLFQAFEQVGDRNRRAEGTGLGLAISKELTEMQGGTMFIESTVDEGTTVTVRLPYDAHKALKTKG